jgi:hypothetical protein
MRSRWAALVAATFVAAPIAAVAAGCNQPESAEGTRTEPAATLDCAYPLVWNDVRYEVGMDLAASSNLGPELGSGVVLGCGSEELGYYPDEDVDVRRIEGTAPSIAVAALLENASEPLVWLAHGYLVESPRHPLHVDLAESRRIDGHEGFTCGGPLTTNARALTTPAPGQPLEVAAEDPEVESLLVAPGAQRLVSVESDTAISGLERHGVPYVERGDEFVLVVRACDGDESRPGLAGLRLLIADSIVGKG